MKRLFIIFFILLCPLFVNAGTDKVNIYIFINDDCKFCDEAIALFDNLDNTSRERITINTYNIDEATNKKLFDNITKFRKENPQYVPYIIIGNKSWEGFDEQYFESIKNKINDELKINKYERYDIMNYVSIPKEKSNHISNNIISLLFIILFTSVFITSIFIIRKRA